MKPRPLWRERDFRRLWIAQSVSDFGARITREGLPMMAVLGLAASPAQLGLLAALASGPTLIAGLAAGGLVDARRRRPPPPTSSAPPCSSPSPSPPGCTR